MSWPQGAGTRNDGPAIMARGSVYNHEGCRAMCCRLHFSEIKGRFNNRFDGRHNNRHIVG